MSSKRLLMFAPYYPPHAGGVETYAAQLAEELARRGYQLLTIAPRLPRATPARDHDRGGDVWRFPAFEPVTNYPLPQFWRATWPRMLRQAAAWRPDIVLSHTRFFHTSVVAGAFAKRLRCPWVHIEHGSSSVSVSNPVISRLAQYYDRTIGRWVFRHSTVTVSTSRAVQRFVSCFDQRPSPMIYRGLRVKTLDALPPFPRAVDEREKIILMTVARLSKWKGLAHAIRAVQQLPAALRGRLLFTIIGAGEDAKRLARMAREPVRLLGERSYAETIGRLKAADIYLHASLPGGGLSTALLEAMCCQRAVIATPHEGADEVIEPEVNGLMVPAGDSTAMRTAIERLLFNPHRRIQLGQRASASVRALVSWQERGDEWEQLLNRL